MSLAGNDLSAVGVQCLTQGNWPHFWTLTMLAASFWTVPLIRGMQAIDIQQTVCPLDFYPGYADIVLTSASMSYEQILACMDVVYMRQLFDEVSKVVKALPQAISLVG